MHETWKISTKEEFRRKNSKKKKQNEDETKSLILHILYFLYEKKLCVREHMNLHSAQ